MKFNFVLFLCIFSAIVNFANAQNLGKVNGSLASSTLINNCIITLNNFKDNKVEKTFVLDSTKLFNFERVKFGTYTVNIVSKYYKKYVSGLININEANLNILMPQITLDSVTKNGTEDITVTSALRFVEKKIDRTVINPDALIGNAGTTALEVLEKSPGVLVDNNGLISLLGKAGVMIFIDDKPTYMAAADLTNYLRSLPSSAVAQIELMTNPPAKYDAAGNAGIINIKLKKTKTIGLNIGFNTSYGQGVYLRNNNSININYRVNKVNYFANLSFVNNNSFQDLYIKRRFFKPNGQLSSIFNQNSYIKKENLGLNAKLGLDYYINKKETFGIVLTGFKNINKSITTNAANISDSSATITNVNNALNPSKRNLNNNGINVNYNNKLKKAGSEISLNADYITYNSDVNQSLLSKNYSTNGTLIARSNLVSTLPATINIGSLNFDYLTPLKKGGRLETGFKTSLVHTDNVANFFDETNNIQTINYDFSNNFDYEENINAAYFNFNRDYKRFSFQTGLRLENTNINGYQKGLGGRRDSSFTRNYNSLFPTIYLQYKADSLQHHVIGFSFGRRINRPNYQDLNPFTYPLDRFLFYGGNPFLQPTFSNNFELSHTYKSKFTTTLLYSITNNEIRETMEQANNIFYSRPGNMGRTINYGIAFDAVQPIKKWWMLQLHAEVMHNKVSFGLFNQQLNNKGTYWYVGPTNQFTINKKWSAELAATYQSSVVVGQFLTIPVGQIRAGVSKKILKNKGSLKLNINDMFLTNEPGGEMKAIADSKASWKSYLDTRVISLAFSYRFNKGKSMQARQNASAEAEKNRVK